MRKLLLLTLLIVSFFSNANELNDEIDILIKTYENHKQKTINYRRNLELKQLELDDQKIVTEIAREAAECERVKGCGSNILYTPILENENPTSEDITAAFNPPLPIIMDISNNTVRFKEDFKRYSVNDIFFGIYRIDNINIDRVTITNIDTNTATIIYYFWDTK